MHFKDFILVGIALVGFYYFNRFVNRKRHYLLKHGVNIVANVVKISDTSIKVGTSSIYAMPVMEVTVEFEFPDNVHRRITIKQALDKRDVPEIGDKINILIDPANHDNILINTAVSR